QLRAPGAAEVLDATTILGAAKLSGKTGNGWSLGVLEAVTQREEARFRAAEGPDGRFAVEPLTNYLVGRARRAMRSGQTLVGGIVTAVNRDLDTDDMRGSLRSGAYAGGVDFRHEWARRSWIASGYATGSLITGEPGVIAAAQRSSLRYFQRPDAGHVDVDADAGSLAGAAAEFTVARQAGRHWRGSATLSTISPGYEANDLGFHTRADLNRASVSATYLETTPGKTFRNWRVQGQARVDGNYDGDHVGNTLFLGSYGLLRNYWSMNFNAGYSFASTDDRLTRGGPAGRRPADWRVYLSLNSDPRKTATGYADGYYGRDELGMRSHIYTAGVTLRPSPRWTLSLGPSITANHLETQFVTSAADPTAAGTFGRRYVFADLDQTTLALDTRLDFTFTPRLTLQLYAQPFVSAGDFSDYKELDAPRATDYSVYGRDRGTLVQNASGTFTADPDGTGPAGAFTFGQFFGQRDFNQRSLRGNAVLRWEWRAGSTLFVAWQQDRSDLDFLAGDFRFGRDREALFNAQPDNVFLIKVNYWLNP
ncbi:MAG TPA: DUF5916 domain-containing protein, partial [Longimicrobiaceae bacterium]